MSYSMYDAMDDMAKERDRLRDALTAFMDEHDARYCSPECDCDLMVAGRAARGLRPIARGDD